MPNIFQEALPSAIVQFLPSAASRRLEHYERIYEANRHRIYSFAFWMTDSEPAAEVLSERTFLRVFSLSDDPTDEMVDRALLRELQCQADIYIQTPQLKCAMVNEVSPLLRRNTKRVDMERAIVQLPYTERMIFCMHDGDGYDHARIARTLEITEDESRQGLHQARLRIRELVNAAPARMAA